MGQVGWVEIALLRVHLSLHHLADRLPLDMDGGHHDMARLQFHQLQDTLTQVSLYHVDPLLHQVGIHVTLLGQHGFTLHQPLHLVLLQDVEHNAVMLLRILRPMDDSSIGCRIPLELLQKCVQMAVGIVLDGRGHISQPLPLRDRTAHLISFRTHHPERIVVPNLIFFVGQELICSYRMSCTHNPEAKICTM